MERIVDDRNCLVGMSCEEYSLITIAGSPTEKLPQIVRQRMEKHAEVCRYHRSSIFAQSVVTTPVIEEVEAEALEIIKKIVG